MNVYENGHIGSLSKQADAGRHLCILDGRVLELMGFLEPVSSLLTHTYIWELKPAESSIT